MLPHLTCTRTRFTLADGRTLSCVTCEPCDPDADPEPLYFLGEPHLAPYWWMRCDGLPDFGPPVALDALPPGLDAIARAMRGPNAYRFHPVTFDPVDHDDF